MSKARDRGQRRHSTRLATARVIRRVARGVLSSEAVPESEAVSADGSCSLPSTSTPVPRAATRRGTCDDCSGCVCRAASSCFRCVGAFRCTALLYRRVAWQCCVTAGAFGGRPMRFPLADSRGRAT